MDMIGGVPWRTQNGDEATDGERLPTELRPDQAEQVSTEIEKENLSKEIAPKGFTITKEDLDTHGYSKGCRGCTAVLRGNRAQTHTAGCRQRLERKMKDVEKVKTAKKKMDEYVAKVIEKDAEGREKQEKVTTETVIEPDAEGGGSSSSQGNVGNKEGTDARGRGGEKMSGRRKEREKDNRSRSSGK